MFVLTVLTRWPLALHPEANVRQYGREELSNIPSTIYLFAFRLLALVMTIASLRARSRTVSGEDLE